MASAILRGCEPYGTLKLRRSDAIGIFRHHAVQASSDLEEWTPVGFRVMTEGIPEPTWTSYQATEVRLLQVQINDPVGAENLQYYRAIVP